MTVPLSPHLANSLDRDQDVHEPRQVATDALRHWRHCSTRRLLRKLGKHTRLVMPSHHFAWTGIAGLILVPVAVVGLLIGVYDPELWVAPAAGLLMAALL